MSLPLSATSVSRWCRACRSRTAVVGSAWSPPTSTCRNSAELSEGGCAWELQGLAGVWFAGASVPVTGVRAVVTTSSPAALDGQFQGVMVCE
jgi:hypothetical protein